MGVLQAIVNGLTAIMDHAAANSGAFVEKYEDAYKRNPTDENSERLNKAYEYKAKCDEYQFKRNNQNNQY